MSAKNKRDAPTSQFPLASKRPDLLKTLSGLEFKGITLEAIVSGQVKSEHLGISPSTLRLQATVAESLGRITLAENLRRAAELVQMSDEKILQIYNALRPNRSGKETLRALVRELTGMQAHRCALLVQEALNVYEARGLLKK